MFRPGGPTLFELARQALSSTERGYDLLAPKFDLTPFRTPDALIERALARIEREGPVGSALDLCCGTGAALDPLRSICRDGAVGLDFSMGMLEVCRERSGGRAATAALVRADALAMPFVERFDLVVCFGALGHFLQRDQPRLLREIARVLRPGGRFVFVTSRRPPINSLGRWLAHGFNAAMRVRNALISPPFVMYYLTFLLPEAERALRDAGFRVEAVEESLFPEHPQLVLVSGRR